MVTGFWPSYIAVEWCAPVDPVISSTGTVAATAKSRDFICPPAKNPLVLLEQLPVIDAALAHELRHEFHLRTERERSRRNHPRLFPHVRILHRHVVLQRSVLEAAEALDDMQCVGMHEPMHFRLVVEA